jgi:hypothetical protein
VGFSQSILSQRQWHVLREDNIENSLRELQRVTLEQASAKLAFGECVSVFLCSAEKREKKFLAGSQKFFTPSIRGVF